MTKTYFFYDLETSGLDPRQDRIMQFAGQRTDEQFQPIGEPYDILVKLNDDTLPSPEAVMVTGITPQLTQADGYTEAEFAKLLIEEIFVSDTTMIGFNNIRFDDEFIRYLLWRNFYDPYEWCYKNGCGRWDLLDVVRMTRALRPDGINWPVDEAGKPTNRLELLTKDNGIDHLNAHDALSDVEALIAVTKMLQQKQPQLFDYMLKQKDKQMVQKLVNLEDPAPFVYVSGRYDAAYHKATVAYPIAPAQHRNVVVYDLRHDPSAFLSLSQDELRKHHEASWQERKVEGFVPLPVKVLQYNRCPAVAPLGVLEQGDTWQRIGLDSQLISKHMNLLRQHPDFSERLRTVFEAERSFAPNSDAEAKLYDGFLNQKDSLRVEAVRNASVDQLSDFNPQFDDERLGPLLLHYKARSFSKSLNESEQGEWEQWRGERLKRQLPAYIASLKKLATSVDSSKHFLLEELQLWAESVMPFED